MIMNDSISVRLVLVIVHLQSVYVVLTYVSVRSLRKRIDTKRWEPWETAKSCIDKGRAPQVTTNWCTVMRGVHRQRASARVCPASSFKTRKLRVMAPPGPPGPVQPLLPWPLSVLLWRAFVHKTWLWLDASESPAVDSSLKHLDFYWLFLPFASVRPVQEDTSGSIADKRMNKNQGKHGSGRLGAWISTCTSRASSNPPYSLKAVSASLLRKPI